MPRQLAHGSNICRLFSIGEESEVLWHLPYEDLAVVGTGGDNVVVEGVPARSGNRTSAWQFTAAGQLNKGLSLTSPYPRQQQYGRERGVSGQVAFLSRSRE